MIEQHIAAAIDPWAFDPDFNQGAPAHRQEVAREKAAAVVSALNNAGYVIVPAALPTAKGSE